MIPRPWPARRPTPEPDFANDPTGYRREAAHRILTHDNEKTMALEMAQLASDDAARLNPPRGTASPWEAATHAFSAREHA